VIPIPPGELLELTSLESIPKRIEEPVSLFRTISPLRAGGMRASRLSFPLS